MWCTSSAAVHGRGHMSTSTPCQDKVISRSNEEVSVIILADGAGSASLSHYGAECVVNAVAQYMCENFQSMIVECDGVAVKTRLLKHCIDTLELESHIRQCEINDLASTLLAVAANDKSFIVVHIGDGVVGYLKGESLKVASVPENGEYANSTIFVTSHNAIYSMRLIKGENKDISAFVLMSDGTESCLYHKQSHSLSNGITNLMQRTCITSSDVMDRLLMEAIEHFVIPKTLDDCSIAIMARPVGALKTYEMLDFPARRSLCGINSFDKSAKRKVAMYDSIYNTLSQPCTLNDISRVIHLKPKYTRKRLFTLIQNGIISCEGSLFRRSIV